MNRQLWKVYQIRAWCPKDNRSHNRSLSMTWRQTKSFIGSKHIVLMVLVAIILIVIRLHAIKLLQATFSNDGMIASDGKGPYVDGYAGISFFEQDASFDMQVHGSSRSVLVRFAGIPWKDYNLTDMPPRFLSRNCRMDLTFYLGNISMRNMEVGRHYKPSEFYIAFLDTDTLKYVTEMTSEDAYNANGTVSSYLPPALNQGHTFLVRENEDTWVLNVNAWFQNTDFTLSPLPNKPQYYVYLNFTMTIEYKNLI
jgi:hypothetical protein